MEQLCQDKNNIAIVGAGPAGIFCALILLKMFKENNFNDYSITIFEKNTPLSTILPTGNGRCNITNSIDDVRLFASNYPRGEKFLYSVFSRFSNYDTVDFFNEIGVSTYIQDDGRVFPVSNSAKDVRAKMLNCVNKNKKVKFIKKSITSFDDLNKFDRVIISAGSRNTFRLIKSCKHNCIPFKKSLCALIIKDFIYPKGVSIKTLDGDIVFTDTGISGPLAFKISSLNAFKEFPYDISIRLFDENKLLDDAVTYPKKSVGNIVSKYIPKSLAKVIVKDFSKNISEISPRILKQYSILNLTVVSAAPCGEIVHAGGVDINEIDKNCKSKIIDNLWFCGEILNIDGFCGGFNLQNCWSTAYVVANNVVETIIN